MTAFHRSTVFPTNTCAREKTASLARMSVDSSGTVERTPVDNGRRTLSDADVEAIARRVHTLVAEAPTPAAPLVTAAELARRFSLGRSWVYEHASELGAVRLGNGARPRLRFDPEQVSRALEAPAVTRTDTPERRPARRRAPASGDLLPIHGRAA